MRIAIVVGVFPRLTETFILHQVTALLDWGHDVRIISFGRPQGEIIHPEVEQYDLLSRTHYIDMPRTRGQLVWTAPVSMAKLFTHYPRSFLTCVGLVEKRAGFPHPFDITQAQRLAFVLQGCDIIQCHFGPIGLKTLPAARAANVPLVVTFHGFDIGEYPRTHGTQVYSSLFQHAEALLCVSDYVSRRLKELGAPADKTILQYITSTLSDVPYHQRKWPDDGPVRLLTIGRLVEKKGLQYSIEAVRRLVSEGVNVKYWIAGEGPLRSKLRDTIAASRLEGHVKLLGQVTRPEVLRLLERSHIFILSSVTAGNGDTEGMPVVLREAQAAGLPVITTDHAGNPEAIQNGVTGFVVPERDVDALHERLRYLIDNPHLWPEMGRAGRKFVEEKFDARRLNERLICIYHNVIAGRKPGHGLIGAK